MPRAIAEAQSLSEPHRPTPQGRCPIGGPMRRRDVSGDGRWLLRSETRAEHDAVDALYARLDVRDASDLRTLLRAHASALAPLVPSLEAVWPDACSAAAVARLIRSDLTTLGDDGAPSPPLVAARAFDGACPLGVAYVVTGAHLGLKLLERRWRGAADPRVRAAGAYLRSGHQKGAWPAVLAALAPLAPRSPACLDGARRSFALYADAFRAHAPPLEDP
ncbi:MAG: hypothetical protein AAF763_09840 [Pseudomonadota bacterium]